MPVWHPLSAVTIDRSRLEDLNNVFRVMNKHSKTCKLCLLYHKNIQGKSLIYFGGFMDERLVHVLQIHTMC